MAKKTIKSKCYPLIIQALLLIHKYPESRYSIKHNQLIWYGKIKPTPVSREYNIRIVCRYERKPKIFLYGDKIEGIEKIDFPHHYHKDINKQEVQLCLNLPIEFDYSLRICDTIVPWTQEWLYFYEIWLSTGHWCGGGHEIKLNNNKNNE